MASQEGIGRTYICLCQIANGQAVCVDVKLLGTKEGLWPVFGCIHYGHMMSCHKHSDICDVWICEGVIYHTPGGISSLMATYDSHILSLLDPSISF
jgi:hypothetical protein